MVSKMVQPQKISKLSDDQIQKVKSLENDLGIVLVAYEQSPYANLSTSELGEVQTLEKMVGATILAYK